MTLVHARYNAATSCYVPQAGANFARQISVGSAFAAAAGAICSGTINAETLDARRQDNVTVVDIRVERPFAVSRLKVRGFVDLFNLTNGDAASASPIPGTRRSR